MPSSADTVQRSREDSNNSSTRSSGQSRRPKTVSESTPARRVSSSYLREAAYLGREPRVLYNTDATQRVGIAWNERRLSGGGPAKPPARSVKKSNSSFSNISAPPIVQNGRQREGREGRGGRGHRATRSNNSLRKENGVYKNDLFRTTNSAPAAGAAKETTTAHRKPPPGPLPKLNNLVATDAHGVTSATQSVRDHSSRHWASSWADAYSRNAASLPRSDTKISTHSRTTQATLDTDGGRSEQRTPRYVSKPVQKRPKRPVIITKKSIYQVQAVTAVYGNRTFKKQRHARILKQLEEIELKDAVEHNQKLVEKEKSVIESKKKQKAALKRLRTRFDEEQVQRFKTQYVTWKSVEHERRGRGPERYGLPETIDDDELTKLVSKKQRKGSQRKFRQPHSREQNIKRFEKLLNPKIGIDPEGKFKIPSNVLLEGIDTVELWSPRSQGEAKPKRATVRNVLGSARKLLRESTGTDMDAISETSSIEDDSDVEDV